MEASPYEGNYLPDIVVHEYPVSKHVSSDEGPKPWRLPDLAHKKKIVAIGVTGAFTPICHYQHLPDYIKHHKAFIKKGVDELWCIAVNDPFVMKAWSESLSVKGKIRMISDGNAELAKALDMIIDLSERGMGVRSCRYAMVVESGCLTHFVKELPGEMSATDASSVLQRL